jgi:hypothetical protein
MSVSTTCSFRTVSMPGYGNTFGSATRPKPYQSGKVRQVKCATIGGTWYMSGVPRRGVDAWVVPAFCESYSAICSPEWMSIALMVAPLGLDKLSHVVCDRPPLPVNRAQPVVMTEGLKVSKY